MADMITKTTHVRAPLDRVWRAISDHREFGQWFRVALDQPFEAGKESTGKMTYPGYEGYPWRAQITAVEPPTSLEFRDGFADQEGQPAADMPITTVRMKLTERDGGGTRMELHSAFDSKEQMEQLLGMGMLEGLQQSVGQMDALLAG